MGMTGRRRVYSKETKETIETVKEAKVVTLPEDTHQPFITGTHTALATSEDGFFLLFSSIDFLHKETTPSELRLRVVSKVHLGNAAMRDFLTTLLKDGRGRELAEAIMENISEEKGDE